MSTARRGLAMLAGVGVMVSICHSSNSYVVADEISPSAIKSETVLSQAVFIATGPSIASNTAISSDAVSFSAIENEIASLIVSNEAISVVSDTAISAEDKPKQIVVKIKKLKAKKIYLTLDEVRKKINKGMDLSKPSGLPKSEFVKLIQNMDYDYTGVFKRNAAYIWTLAHKYQFNEIFFMGIIANESKWGKYPDAIACNNYTGQKVNGKLLHYSSERKCLKKTAQSLGIKYLTEGGEHYNGTTLYEVNKEYCEPGIKKVNGKKKVYKYMWADDVYTCMQMIVG